MVRSNFVSLVVVALLVSSAAASAQTSDAMQADSPNLRPAPTETIDEEALSRFITALVREHLPDQYEDRRDWGRTKRVFDGLHIRREGLEIKTKRRWKDANHGTWKVYRVWLLDPEKQFRLTVENIRQQENGAAAFDLHADAWLGLSGRVSEWRRDVQLFSLSAEGTARVRLSVKCEVAMRLDPRKLPPDLVLAPKVTAADLQIHEFRIDRVSQVGGELAEEIGRGMRRALEEKLAEDRSKLADKCNRQIAKHQDRLRLSLHGALASKWGRWIEPERLEQTP